MSVTVLDSSNLSAMIADATGEYVEEQKAEETQKEEAKTEKEHEKADDKSDVDNVSRETKSDEKERGDEVDPEDVEGEDGLTPRQKREFTQSMLKTIGKKHREKKEAEEFASAQYNERKLAEQRALELERRIAEIQPQVDTGQAKAEEKPQPANYNTQEEYIDALTEWKVDAKIRVIEQQRAREALISVASSRINRAIELVPDYRDKIDAVGDTPIPPVVGSYMQKSPMIAELGYHFAEHPDVLVSLKNMEPDDQLVTIGKIEAKLKPFSESVKDSKSTSDGAKPSSTEAKKQTASEISTGAVPSKARNVAPVIQPLSTTGTVDKEVRDMNIRETIVDWQKHNSTNLSLRKRH
jgi:hypothetical protein